jgi:hypothetical protein
LIDVLLTVQLCSLLEADFGLQFRRLVRTKVHNGAGQRFSDQGVPGSNLNLDQDDNIGRVDGMEDAKEHARRAAVTFEFVLIAFSM